MSTTTTTQLPTLTDAETAVIRELDTFEYLDGNELANWQDWQWSFTEDAAGAAGMTTRQIKGVLASLQTKGLIECMDNGPRDERTTTVTELGALMHDQLKAAASKPAPKATPKVTPVVQLPARKACPTCGARGQKNPCLTKAGTPTHHVHAARVA